MTDSNSTLDEYFKSIDERFTNLTSDLVTRIPSEFIKSKEVSDLVEIYADMHATAKSRNFRLFHKINEVAKVAKAKEEGKLQEVE